MSASNQIRNLIMCRCECIAGGVDVHINSEGEPCPIKLLSCDYEVAVRTNLYISFVACWNMTRACL
jgi:hypothetical protein